MADIIGTDCANLILDKVAEITHVEKYKKCMLQVKNSMADYCNYEYFSNNRVCEICGNYTVIRNIRNAHISNKTLRRLMCIHRDCRYINHYYRDIIIHRTLIG